MIGPVEQGCRGRRWGLGHLGGNALFSPPRAVGWLGRDGPIVGGRVSLRLMANASMHAWRGMTMQPARSAHGRPLFCSLFSRSSPHHCHISWLVMSPDVTMCSILETRRPLKEATARRIRGWVLIVWSSTALALASRMRK